MTLEQFLANLFNELIAHATKFLNMLRGNMGLPEIEDEDVTE